MIRVNNIKRIFVIICLLMFMQIVLPTLNCARAALTDDFTLIKSDIVTITKKTTIDDINTAYGGEARIITKTPHGGHAYTWYRENYADLIFVETNEYENIVSAGICAENFESTLCKYGDGFSPTIGYMQGSTIEDWNEGVKACIVYNKDTLDVNKYITEYMKDSSSYDKYLAKHAIAVINQFFTKDGDSEVTFNEELYDKLQRIEDSGISIEDYAKKNKKDSLYKYAGGDLGWYSLYESLPNPIRLAALNGGKYIPSDVCNNLYLRYHIVDPSSNNGATIDGCFVSENIVDKNDTYVPLTEDEQQKYEKAKKKYEDSVEIFNSSGSDTFKTQANFKDLPLTTGEIYENKLIGATMFLNTIRVGAGFPEVEYDKTLSNYAQHKAVLTRYISLNNIPNPTPHYPTKPDGVDDGFYNNAMKGMAGENLYSGGDIISTISNAIKDTYDNNFFDCGHRANLLNPSWKYFGIGYIDGQGCHKLSGNQSCSNITAVAWPSIGVTPTQAYDGAAWTIDLYSYSITDDTTVDIVRLNDNRKWSFKERTTSGQNKFYVKNRHIAIYNSSLTGNDGEVYQITVHNLKAGDRDVPEYTYRAAFKSLYGENVKPVDTEFVKLDKPEINIYIGEKVQVTPSFSEGATEIATNFSSSDENVATVSQYGTITAKNKGNATITVTTVNGKSATCEVVVNDTVLLKENSKILKLEETSKIELSEEVEDVLYISSNGNVASVDSSGNITGVSSGMCKITVSKAGYKSAECFVYVKNPITFSDNTRGYIGDTNLDGIIDYNDYLYIKRYKGTESGKNKEICDLVKNGKVDESDLKILSNFAKARKSNQIKLFTY